MDGDSNLNLSNHTPDSYRLDSLTCNLPLHLSLNYILYGSIYTTLSPTLFSYLPFSKLSIPILKQVSKLKCLYTLGYNSDQPVSLEFETGNVDKLKDVVKRTLTTCNVNKGRVRLLFENTKVLLTQNQT